MTSSRARLVAILCLLAAIPIRSVPVVDELLLVKSGFDLYTELYEKLNHETTEENIMAKFAEVSGRVQRIEQRVADLNPALFHLGTDILVTGELNDRLRTVHNTMNSIRLKHRHWQLAVKHAVTNRTARQMADDVIGETHGVPTVLAQLQLLVADDSPARSVPYRSLPDVMLAYFALPEHVCMLGKSVQQAMVEFFDEVRYVCIQGAILVSMAWSDAGRVWQRYVPQRGDRLRSRVPYAGQRHCGAVDGRSAACRPCDLALRSQRAGGARDIRAADRRGAGLHSARNRHGYTLPDNVR